MPENTHRTEKPGVQEYFAHLNRSEKVLDWVYGSLFVGCFLALVAGLALFCIELFRQ